jgi:hypothetical protein
MRSSSAHPRASAICARRCAISSTDRVTLGHGCLGRKSRQRFTSTASRHGGQETTLAVSARRCSTMAWSSSGSYIERLVEMDRSRWHPCRATTLTAGTAVDNRAQTNLPLRFQGMRGNVARRLSRL